MLPLLIVGLGNPGEKHEGTRHNIGFMVVDAIADHHTFPSFQLKHEALLSEAHIDGQKVILAKPQTFMNLSGQSVQAIVKFYKIPLSNIVVVYDELGLVPGKIRVREGGGANGHNGIKNIDQHMGKNYFRVRFGIGHPGDKDVVHGYVLSRFSKQELPLIEKKIAAIVDCSDLLIAGEYTKFMTKVALYDQEQKKSAFVEAEKE